MKFLCVPCDSPMILQKTDSAEAGSLDLVFHCPACDYSIAMLTNTGETQLVQSLGVHIGQGNKPVSPMAVLRANLSGIRSPVLNENEGQEIVWTEAAEARLAKHPRFVQPVIRKTYADYSRQRGINEITPEVMDAAQISLSET